MFQVWRSRDGDQRHEGAFQFERLYARVTPWRIVLAGVGLAAYLLGLAIFLPAEAAVGSDRNAVGTVWKGQVGLPPAFAAGWTVRPLRSLLSLSAETDVRIIGPDTLIEGRIQARPDRLLIREAGGSGSVRLLNGLAPQLPFACDGHMRVTIANLAVQGGAQGDGVLTIGPSACAAAAGPTTSIDSVTAQLYSGVDGSSANVTGADGARLADGRMAKSGAMRITVEPAASGVLPGVSPGTLEIAP